MYYKSERFLRFGLLALTISLLGSGIAYAQSDDALLPTLDNGAPNAPAANARPTPSPASGAASLFDDAEDDANGLISPQPKQLPAAPTAQAQASAPLPVQAQAPGQPNPVRPPVPSLDVFEEENLNEPVANALPMPSGNPSAPAARPQAPAPGTPGASGGAPMHVGTPAAAPVSPAPKTDVFAEDILKETRNELFSQMSNLEKQTALLNLEFRREKAKNEIDALKFQRQKALDEEAAKREEVERKKIEWENDQKKKLMVEEQKLVEMNTAYEKVRQAKLLKAYKNTMLEENQQWINGNEKLFASVKIVENERDDIANMYREKMGALKNLADRYVDNSRKMKDFYEKQLADLSSQLAIVNSRLTAAETIHQEMTASPDGTENPFASVDGVQKKRLGDDYYIVEIRGQGEDMLAKLRNENGTSFMAKVGTILQTGHVIDEITRTQIRAVRNGVNDYIYFSAGGVIEKEPVGLTAQDVKDAQSENSGKTTSASKTTSNASSTKKPAALQITNDGLPSLADGMFAR